MSLQRNLRARLQQRAELVEALLVQHDESSAMLFVDAELRRLETEDWESEWARTKKTR